MEKGICLDRADLSRLRLENINLDGLRARGASFWGSDLENTDLGAADLRGTDLRCTNLKDVCLAQSNISGSDLRGAYFSRTIVEGAVLDEVKVSCPSFWGVDLRGVESFKGLVFQHLGEEDIEINTIPLVIHGLESTLVVAQTRCFFGNTCIPQGDMTQGLETSLQILRVRIDQILRQSPLPSANPSNLKIVEERR